MPKKLMISRIGFWHEGCKSIGYETRNSKRGEKKMEKSRLAAIWDDSENGWYFRADQHEGFMPTGLCDTENPEEVDENLIDATREFARYCGVSPAGDVEIVR
jgi:hypothetical protein